MFRHILFLIAVAGIIGAAQLAATARPNNPVLPPPVEPPVKPSARAIAAAGLVEAVRENTAIGVPIPALVTAVDVKVWDKVKAGQPLMRLDDRDLRATLGSLRAAESAAKAETESAEATFAATDAERRRIADTLTRWNAIDNPRAISAEDLARVRSEAEVATARLAAARAGVTRAQANAELAAAKVAECETLIERLVVKAPIDGTVLQVNTRAGEFASPGAARAPIIIGDIETLQLRCDIDEQIAPRMRPGLPAIAYLKGDATHRIPLIFERIEPFVVPKQSLTGASIERVDTRVLQVIYSFPSDAARPVYVGQQMDVYIEEN